MNKVSQTDSHMLKLTPTDTISDDRQTQKY